MSFTVSLSSSRAALHIDRRPRSAPCCSSCFCCRCFRPPLSSSPACSARFAALMKAAVLSALAWLLLLLVLHPFQSSCPTSCSTAPVDSTVSRPLCDWVRCRHSCFCRHFVGDTAATLCCSGPAEFWPCWCFQLVPLWFLLLCCCRLSSCSSYRFRRPATSRCCQRRVAHVRRALMFHNSSSCMWGARYLLAVV